VLRLSGSLKYKKDEQNWSFKFEKGKLLLGAKSETMRDTTKMHVINIPASEGGGIPLVDATYR
jgi:hypothetical protein